MFAQTFPHAVPRLLALPSALLRPRAAQALLIADDDRLLRLATDELASLRIETIGRIVVLRGRAWITVDGEPADHFVARGESLALQPGGVVRIGGDAPGATLVRFVPEAQAVRAPAVPAATSPAATCSAGTARPPRTARS